MNKFEQQNIPSENKPETQKVIIDMSHARNEEEKMMHGKSNQTAGENPEKVSAKKKMRPGLYDINEVDGEFEVILPGAFDKENEEIVGMSRKKFKTREEAERVMESARENIKVQSERASLEKTFTKCFYRIDETQDGKFRVVLPGLIDSKTGYYVGTTHKDFDSWNEARDYFLQQRESEEKLTQKPLLEIQTGENERLLFSDFDSFNPRVAPSEKEHKIPDSIEKYLLNKEKIAGSKSSASTYQETIREQGWEKKIYSFVSSYLEKDGLETAKQLKIEHLESLTPKQAIELATQIVIDLTKYKRSDTFEERQKKGEDLSKKTQADQNSVLQLLKEGQMMRNDPDWEGNGICRNFASSVKAVFEALKANQTKYSYLKNLYCTYEDGFEHKPKKGRQFESGEHAWNTFIIVSEKGETNATITDVTWAERNLETKEVEHLDYTLTRMEPVVNELSRNVSGDDAGKTEQLKHILSYYLLKIERIDSGKEEKRQVNKEEEKQYYLLRLLNVINDNNLYESLTKDEKWMLAENSFQVCDGFDNRGIENLWNLTKSIPEIKSRFSYIMRDYFKNKELSNCNADIFIFRDDDLQVMTFEELKLSEDWDKFLKESPKFRVRMREALPRLFMDFSPATKQEDLNELLSLVGKSGQLRNWKNRVGETEDSISNFFLSARNQLAKINSENYQKLYANIDDYQLIKNYDQFVYELKNSK